MQIRYNGCKGTLSVKPELDNRQHQLVVRESMEKFESEHYMLEVCKVSSPRPLYLNRQTIVLLSNRGIPDSNFLVLQNQNLLWLVQSFLNNEYAFKLLNEKVLDVFPFKKLAKYIDLVNEIFFKDLLIGCCLTNVLELLKRTRIKIPKMEARNMFGIVDEYRVLEYGQVFIQYTPMYEEEINGERRQREDPKILNNCLVAITKNPCHHPGDIRTFNAVDHPKLRHLKDVVVFPQKGPRPHSNEISGSDLDGDEYAVIWHEDLVPNTENYEAYVYDTQDNLPKHPGAITREDINKVVLDIAEQDCLGRLSNLHLAYADRLGVDDEKCKELAGVISKEVDSGKTGIHPMSEAQIKELAKGLDNKRPDFMENKNMESYASSCILGKLYRASCRSISGWNKLLSYHRHLKHFHIATPNDEDEQSLTIEKYEQKIYIDELLLHENYKQHIGIAEKFFYVYKQELLEILSLYHLQHETDLFCRGSKQNEIEDSAQCEFQQLIDRMKHGFYLYVINICPSANCSQEEYCDSCLDHYRALSSACYYHCYQEANKATSRRQQILSFPWIFGRYLIAVKLENLRGKEEKSSTNRIFGMAMCNALQKLINENNLRLEVNTDHGLALVLFNKQSSGVRSSNRQRLNYEIDWKIIVFIEIINDWLNREQKILSKDIQDTENEISRKPLVSYECWNTILIKFIKKYSTSSTTNFNELSIGFQQKSSPRNDVYYGYIISCFNEWNNNENFNNEMFDIFYKLLNICFEHSLDTEDNSFAYLSEYIILFLQQIAIRKELKN
ncbi:unnamed protein product [Didymodactylos carnosus]|uniref:RNA-dependent RNA polymerase n=1 Tax=Didymodactylos carnosus TaxID=1234261 RepID=A0A815I065_9BILA|nr:unnamed protein product [Didymodactylos carnosus]CAF4235828.1 unnamed protein product [Didymodactylos carnosus]